MPPGPVSHLTHKSPRCLCQWVLPLLHVPTQQLETYHQREADRSGTTDFPSSQLLRLRPSSACVSLSLKYIFYFHPSLTDGGNGDRQVTHLRTHISVRLRI